MQIDFAIVDAATAANQSILFNLLIMFAQQIAYNLIFFHLLHRLCRSKTSQRSRCLNN